MSKGHRNTISLEQAEVLSHEAHPGAQYILRVRAPECAAFARPGQFAHLQVDDMEPMRRPISIMRASAEDGWVDFLYKSVGRGTELLTRRTAGEHISVLGPIGKAFTIEAPRPLLIGGGVGMPPMICLAEELSLDADRASRALAILGSEVPFPFQSKPSSIMVPGAPDGVIAAMPLLEQWGIASRLTSLQGYAGCHQGYVTDLARVWLDALSDAQRAEVCVYSCGPHPMLEAVVALAREYDIPAQVSLEEFMACAVGGCAGCVVEVNTPTGNEMRRVCVDGPVFDGYQVFA